MHLPPTTPTTSGKINNKIKLKNDIIGLLQKNKVGWTAPNALSMGTQFVNTVAGCLWAIDGHHETLAQRSYGIPDELKFLSGYNKPENHKHRKRHADVLTHSLVTEHSIGLLNLTEMSYMKAEAWVGVRAVLLKLAINLRKYATYLEHQCKVSNEHHNAKRATLAFGTAGGASSSSGCFQILEPCRFMCKPTITGRYKRLADALADSEDFKQLCVNTFAPVEPWRKYEYLKAMVLPVRVVKFTHSSACQNMIFLWKVPTTASAYSSSILPKSNLTTLTEISAHSLSSIYKIIHTGSWVCFNII